jgi:hypothetical protein
MLFFIYHKVTSTKISYLVGYVTIFNLKTLNEMSLITFLPKSSCVYCVVITNYHVQMASCDIIFISGFMKSSQQVEEKQLN